MRWKGCVDGYQPNAITALSVPPAAGNPRFSENPEPHERLVDGVKINGEVTLDGENIYDERWIPHTQWQKGGIMVFSL